MTDHRANELRSIALSDAEARALNVEAALGPVFMGPASRSEYLDAGPGDPAWNEEAARENRLARQLGYANDVALEHDSERLGTAISTGAALRRTDWDTLLRVMRALIDLLGTEWQTVVGLTEVEAEQALQSVERKVRASFER